jgi:hypothetical protein
MPIARVQAWCSQVQHRQASFLSRVLAIREVLFPIKQHPISIKSEYPFHVTSLEMCPAGAQMPAGATQLCCHHRIRSDRRQA